MTLQNTLKERLRNGEQGMFTVIAHKTEKGRLIVDEIHREDTDYI